MIKIISATEAANLIDDGATIGVTGFGLAGYPEDTSCAIEERFIKTGHPRDLTLVHSSGVGDWNNRGSNHFGHKNMLKRWIGGHCAGSPYIGKLIMDNEVEAYNLPQGVISQLFREIAAKRIGLISKVGMGTFVDPRIDGGKVSQKAVENMEELIEINNNEVLFYKSFPINVALIRGTTADENGNLTMEKEGLFLDALSIAQAAHNSGGIVIAQVEYLAARGSLPPKQVKVPGILVDYIVVAKPENHMQGAATIYNPGYAGHIKVPVGSFIAPPLDERKVIARRAAMEMYKGSIVNLGIGIPEGVSAVAAEEKVDNFITLTTESGTISGIPAGGVDFGLSSNCEAIIEQQNQFDFYDGGGIDIAFLGLAQADKNGNVNVSKFGPKVAGCGGFINITQNARKVVFCGTLTTGGLKVKIDEGKLVIVNEGKTKKFINSVEQITFSGLYARKIKQPVLFITERAVFSLQPEGVTLQEVAPGIDIERDIISNLDFKPQISSALKVMSSEIFSEKWGGLKEILESNKNARRGGESKASARG